jgi:hypothetical protein
LSNKPGTVLAKFCTVGKIYFTLPLPE